jgi:hypothetical protein
MQFCKYEKRKINTFISGYTRTQSSISNKKDG